MYQDGRFNEIFCSRPLVLNLNIFQCDGKPAITNFQIIMSLCLDVLCLFSVTDISHLSPCRPDEDSVFLDLLETDSLHA